MDVEKLLKILIFILATKQYSKQMQPKKEKGDKVESQGPY